MKAGRGAVPQIVDQAESADHSLNSTFARIAFPRLALRPGLEGKWFVAPAPFAGIKSVTQNGDHAMDGSTGSSRSAPRAVRVLSATAWTVAFAVALGSWGCSDANGRQGTDDSDRVHTSYRLVHEFGGQEDALYFTTIVDGFLHPDSAIIVADAQERTVSKVHLGGRSVVQLGGSGDGPGEFRNITAVGTAAAGGVWVTDRRTGRVTLLDYDEERYTATATVHDYFFAPPVAPEGPLALLSDGTLLVVPGRPEVRPLFPDTLVQYHLLRVDLSGSVVDTLLSPPPAAFDGLLFERPDGGYTLTRKFLNETPRIAVSPTGSQVGFVHRSAGLSDSVIGTLYLVDVDRDPVRVDTIPIPGRSIPADQAEFLRRAESLGIEGWVGGPSAFAEAAAEQLDVPDMISPIFTYRIDSEGAQWLAVEAEVRGEPRWLRKAPGQVEWRPVEFDRPVRLVLDARGQLVAGLLVDELDRQSVGVFERGALPVALLPSRPYAGRAGG